MGVISLNEYRTATSRESSIESQGVIHLPVAPQVTARTRFASGDPLKTQFMLPHDAIQWLEEVVEAKGECVKMVAITGPGDPLAVPDTTIKTLELVREKYPNMTLALKTLGIGGERFAKDMANAGVSYIEMPVYGIQKDVLEKLFAWIRPGLKTLNISEGVELLVKEQNNCVPSFKFHDIEVVVHTLLFPGYNLDQVPLISRNMMEMGADAIALTPYTPEPGAEVTLAPLEQSLFTRACARAEKYLPVRPSLFYTSKAKGIEASIPQLPKPKATRPNVAVVSSNGMDIDLHLGHAIQVLIYGPRADGLHCLLETRELPEPGGGKKRWQELAYTINDCFALLAAGAGTTPKIYLSEKGTQVVITEETIEGCVDVLYGGGKKKK